MIPVGAIAVGVMILVRVINAANKGSSSPRTQTRTAPKSHAIAGRDGAVGAVIFWIIALPIAVPCLIAGIANAMWLPTVVGLGLVAFMFPWTTTRLVFIWAKRPKLAHAMARFAAFTWSKDPGGGGAFAAAWALARRSRRRPDLEGWIEERINRTSPLRGGGLAAAGLLCATRGDLEGARLVLESVELLDPKVTPGPARELAREYLALDCAERGDWPRAHELTRGSPQSRTMVLLHAATGAIGHLPDGPRGALTLWFWWAFSRRRSRTFDFVRRAVEQSRLRNVRPWPRPAWPGDADIPGDALGQALALHLAALSADPRAITPKVLETLGDHWSAALDDPMLTWHVNQRALTLDATQVHTLIPELREQAIADLAHLALTSGCRLSSFPTDRMPGAGILGAVVREVRERLLREVEEASAALRSRINAQKELPVLDEWREFLQLRARYNRAVNLAGDEVRRLAFAPYHDAACGIAVSLWNKRKQRTLGNAIFLLLKDEAARAGDASALELETKNAALGA